MVVRLRVLMALAIVSAWLGACGDDDSAPAAQTSTPTHTVAATATLTRTPTSAPTATATQAPTATTTATQPPTPTSTMLSIAQQLAATGIGRYLGTMPTEMKPKGDWTEYFYDPADERVLCLRGGKYQVNLRRGTSNHVLLYLEGGGACSNYQTCWQAPLAKLTAGSATTIGILELNNPDNPFGDWNIIYAPYCDGSVFAGDNIADYNGKRTFHHGLQNLSAAVSLMQREFVQPDLIVVSGSSAGGYGTFTGYGVARVAYPDTRILVLDDSGPGLQNPNDAAAAAERATNWKYTQFIPVGCTDCSQQIAYLTDWALDHDPTLRAAYFDYLQDSVLGFFLKLDAQAFESLLRDVSDGIQSRHPTRFKRFLKQGELHTVLETTDFYTLAIGDTTIRDWTADFLTDGPAWQDLIEEP